MGRFQTSSRTRVAGHNPTSPGELRSLSLLDDGFRIAVRFRGPSRSFGVGDAGMVPRESATDAQVRPASFLKH